MVELEKSSEQDNVPWITLRIPGPWESPGALESALKKGGGGLVISEPEPGGEVTLVHRASGRRFGFETQQPDDEIADLFAESGRMHPDELRALGEHKVKLLISGPGGSRETAREFLAMGAALIRAGGLGVMVDNSGLTHGPRDWLDLAGDRQMGGLYWAFVAVTASVDAIFSSGMHCLGFRDAELPDPVDPQTGGMIVHEFLGYTYQSGVPVLDGDPIGGPDGPEFVLRHAPCTRFPVNTPWYNPYGIWRLEKFEG